MSGLRVLIDGYNLALEKGTGVSTYARNLSRCLTRIGNEVDVVYGRPGSDRYSELEKEVTFFDYPSQNAGITSSSAFRLLSDFAFSLFGYSAYRVPRTGTVILDDFGARLPHCHSLWNCPSLYRRAHVAFGVTRRLRNLAIGRTPQVVHWTYPLPLKVKGAVNIYTIHDLVPLRLPYTTLDNKRYYLRLCRRITREADHIVTVSESSRKDIIELLGVSPEKVTNTYQTADIPLPLKRRPLEEVAAEIQQRFGLLPRGYFLFFGALEPKKNLGRLIEGYLASGVKTPYLASGVRTPLVIVGPSAWAGRTDVTLPYDANLRSILESGHRSEGTRIVRLEYLPFEVLVSLIRCARATLFPSLYEGFGLPVLESMILGTPVLSSITSSLPELAGDCALLVDPYDTQGIAEGIRALDTNPGLRAELAAKGLARAALFDSAHYEERLANLYSSLKVSDSASA